MFDNTKKENDISEQTVHIQEAAPQPAGDGAVMKLRKKLWKARKKAKKKIKKMLGMQPTTEKKKVLSGPQRYIQSVAEKTGWTPEEAKAQLKDARERLGISYQDYNKYNFHKLSPDEQAEAYQNMLDEKDRARKAAGQKRQHVVEQVMQATGWDKKTVLVRIRKAQQRTGCTPKEYLVYRLYELDEAAQDEVFLMDLSLRLAGKYDVNTRLGKIICDKELTNQYFSKYLKRPWCINTKISFSEFEKKFGASKKIIYKPINGNQGKGIEAYELNPDNMRIVYEELAAFPDGVVEQYVEQHPRMNALAPHSVNTVRLVTISSKTAPVTEDGRYMDLAYAALRIGAGDSVTDNFHQGGMVAAVDQETGRVVTHAADMNGTVFEVHPVTNVPIKGFEIPYFAEALQMVWDICTKRKISGYLGWDIAITADGPVLIEVNLKPAVALLNMPYLAEQKGMKSVMEKYLHVSYKAPAEEPDETEPVEAEQNDPVQETSLEGKVSMFGFVSKKEQLALQEKLDALEKKLVAYERKTKNLEKELSAAQEQNSKFQKKIADYEKQIHSLETRATELERTWANPVQQTAAPVSIKQSGKSKVSAAAEQSQQVPETPYGTKISSITKDGIEFYWKKLEIADGYEIFRSYREKGPFERIAVIEKRSIGTYMDSQFDHEQKHVFYTIRSYLNQKDGSCTRSETVAPKEAVFIDRLTPERTATYLYSGTTRKIRAFWGWGEPEDLKWSSDNENIATVSDDGVITAIASGSCTLTCSSESVGQSATTQVVVDRKACEPLGPIESRYHMNETNGYWENENASDTNDAVIMMVGDMMCGKRQMQVQYSEEEGWNFNDSYTYVKEMTATADFSVGNLETLLASGWPYMLDETYIDNMNNCNATSRYLDAVKYGGFDAVVMANNHNCDGGTRALQETIEQVDKYQLAHTGVFQNKSDARYFIANINGIKVGFLSYISLHTGFNGKDEGWSAEDKKVLLNIFTGEKARKDVAACKAAGAEYVIAYMHWGFKNFRNVAKQQIEEAQIAADAGIDYIVGSNPHMVQAYDILTSEDGRKVPCAYSVGNFQSIMKQVVGNRDSLILRIRLQKNAQGEVTLAENNYIPCYAYTECDGNHWAPVAVSENFNESVEKKNRKKIHDRIVRTVGKKIKKF